MRKKEGVSILARYALLALITLVFLLAVFLFEYSSNKRDLLPEGLVEFFGELIQPAPNDGAG